MKTLKTWVAAGVLAALTGAAQASLVVLGDGTVKDTTTNLIWLQDWNVNGRQAWATQTSWAQDLVFAGSSDWQLPTADQYADLYAGYGNLMRVSEFQGVQGLWYWSSTDGNTSQRALDFAPYNGTLYQS